MCAKAHVGLTTMMHTIGSLTLLQPYYQFADGGKNHPGLAGARPHVPVVTGPIRTPPRW